MLQETADRVQDIVPPERVFVITNARHIAPVREQLPYIPAENIVGEPEGRDSAPAIGLMAALLEKTMGAETVMVVLPADHVVTHDTRFRELLLQAASVAQDGWLVTLGIPPTGPDTGYGYIQRGEPLDIPGAGDVYAVRRFREKPDQDTAARYVDSGDYLWNAGMFIATVKTLRSLFQTHLPQMEGAFSRLIGAFGTADWERALHDGFPLLPKVSFDYGIVEHAERVAVLPADIGWNDVGSWARLADALASDKDTNNVVVGEHLGVDTHGAFIYSPHRLVATIGMEDILVIDTPDVTLICPKSRAEDVKLVVEELRRRGRHDLL